MSSHMARCKITVLKRTIDRDLIDEYLEDGYEDVGPCEIFKDGQEFVIESDEEFSIVPEGFCAWAWADIRKDILTIATGGNMPGFRQPGTVIVGCTDWFRPVIFKVERVESA
jgi:uncharacterized repeat protein (TIGR04076 family)